MRELCEKREKIAAQEQATLEAEIAVEGLQRLRMREEAERLEGRRLGIPRAIQRRSDAEAARRVAEGTWVDVATARGRRKARGKTKDKDRDADDRSC